MNKGAFIISREIFENPIWQDVQKFRIFFYILGQAVFSDEGVRKGNVHIKKGQYLRSYRNLQSDLEYIENRKIKEYPISTISRKVSTLVDEERLKIEDTELGTLFTVVNYESYQMLDNYKKNEHGTVSEQSGNSVGTEQEQNRNNNKNVKNVKNEKENSRKQVYDESSLYYKMADYFYKLILNNNPEHRKPNYQKWADDFRKLVELDKKDKDQVRQVMEYVQADDFEMVNVLSPVKLRKRYDNLYMKMSKSNKDNVINLKGGATTNDPRNYEDHVGVHGVQLYK